jgi:2-polyprenyl-6-methoxyphenol hydroxylase-like FAD-dependent oxidoreductase
MHFTSRIAWPAAGVVLLGDSAHNVTPQLGQGCNSALEDTAKLSAALGAAAPAVAAAAAAAGPEGGDGRRRAAACAAVAAGLAEYEARRLPQVHALQRIEEENAWVRRPAAPGREPARMTYMRVGWAATVLLLAAAHAALPRGVRPAASLFENVMGTTAPYDRLRWAICAAPVVCAALAAGAALALAALVRAVLLGLGWA